LASSYLRIGVAGVAFVFAACLTGPLNAQPKGQTKPPLIEATNAATSATRACANIWASKDKEDLESDFRSFKDGMQTKLDDYRKGREELLKNIKEVHDKLEEVSWDGVVSSAVSAETQERADKKGILSKAQVKATAAAVWENRNKSQEAELKAKLAALSAEQTLLQRRLLGWYAYAAIVNDCFEDQVEHLKKQGDKPIAAITPPPPNPQNSGDITLFKGNVAGLWHATCVYDKSNYPVDGRFTMVFKGDSSLNAAFVDGNAASVNGSLKPGGAITANGTVNMQNFVIRITMQGKIERRKDGSVFGFGTFQSNDGGDIKCKGTWSGG